MNNPLEFKLSSTVPFCCGGFLPGGMSVHFKDSIDKCVLITNSFDYYELKDASLEECIQYVKDHYHGGVLIVEEDPIKE